jgi:hypothetical protein
MHSRIHASLFKEKGNAYPTLSLLAGQSQGKDSIGLFIYYQLYTPCFGFEFEGQLPLT